MREEARLITEAPLTIMPPPSYATSDGTSLRTTTCSKAPFGGTKEKKAVPTRPTIGALGLKRKAPEDSGPSKRSFVTPSVNSISHASSSLHTARPSLSYTVVGVRKPDGGFGRELMQKPTKKSVSKPVPSWKELESSGAPLRFKRMVKPQIRGQPTGFFRMSSLPKALRSPHLALATKACVKASERPMIFSSRVL